MLSRLILVKCLQDTDFMEGLLNIRQQGPIKQKKMKMPSTPLIWNLFLNINRNCLKMKGNCSTKITDYFASQPISIAISPQNSLQTRPRKGPQIRVHHVKMKCGLFYEGASSRQNPSWFQRLSRDTLHPS